MAVEVYFCQNCDHRSETFNAYSGFGCPKCYGNLKYGIPPAPSVESTKNRLLSRPLRRGGQQRQPVDPTVKELYTTFQRELLDLRESEEIHYMHRRNKIHEENVVRKEAFERKAKAAVVVFHAFNNAVTEELDENERLFSGVDVSTPDELETPDYHEDFTHLERDMVDDIPFGELIAPSFL
jgi:hypothetical protein